MLRATACWASGPNAPDKYVIGPLTKLAPTANGVSITPLIFSDVDNGASGLAKLRSLPGINSANDLRWYGVSDVAIGFMPSLLSN